MNKNRSQTLKDELRKLNIHYINGDFIYSKTAENLPSSYSEYLKNKEAYPHIDAYLSLELHSMVPQPEEIERDGYTNNLMQKQTKPAISETIILQSDELIVKDDDVPDNLKKAGYTLERGNVILKIIKDDGLYRLVNYDGSRQTSTLLGGHNSKSRTILMNDVTICIDSELDNKNKKAK